LPIPEARTNHSIIRWLNLDTLSSLESTSGSRKKLGRLAGITQVGEVTGYASAFLLSIYGGFFSGGYVTMLTAAFVVFFGMTFLQAVATTKVINVFSSGVATLVFVWRGVVDLNLGIILGVSMFLGALLGSRITLRLSTVWLRRIFIAAVVSLAVKLLLRPQ
jgi:uncharacterized protein